jgi:hypothetical protein
MNEKKIPSYRKSGPGWVIWFLGIGLFWLLSGCTAISEQSGSPAPGASSGTTCIGDPDNPRVCGSQIGLWTCQDLPNGQRKCVQNTPDGSQGWSCAFQFGDVVCTKPATTVPGNSGWDCVGYNMSVTCTSKDNNAPPAGASGGGDWSCAADAEFITCTESGAPGSGSSGGSTPTGANPPPPAGGEGICLFPDTAAGAPANAGSGPLATLLTATTKLNGTAALYVKVVFSRSFVDNTYGLNSSSGYGKAHQFKDLVGSDKVVLSFLDATGAPVLSTALDFIHTSTAITSGYRSLGVSGGDGKMLKGSASAVLHTTSSLDRNFNDHGYVLTTDSPVTDLKYTPDPKYPLWNFAVEYETWVRLDVFGTAGFGKVQMASVHASPSRMGTNTIPVIPGACPTN